MPSLRPVISAAGSRAVVSVANIRSLQIRFRIDWGPRVGIIPWAQAMLLLWRRDRPNLARKRKAVTRPWRIMQAADEEERILVQGMRCCTRELSKQRSGGKPFVPTNPDGRVGRRRGPGFE